MGTKWMYAACAAVCAAVGLASFGAGADENADLLARIDRFRTVRSDAVAEVQLREIDTAASALRKEHAYRVYLNTQSESVVEMLSPEERGRRVLMTDDAVWLYIPSSNRPIRITPLQRLLGQANYGDVGRMAWHTAYRIKTITEENGLVQPALAAARLTGLRFTDASRLPLRHLVLEAANPTATYPRVDIWVNAADMAPIRADYYLTSGKLLKTGWFSAPEETPNGPATRAIAFIDDKSSATVTVMTTVSVQRKDLAHGFFTVRGFTRKLAP